MEKYIRWDDVWEILKKVEYEKYDEDLGMQDILHLLQEAHGMYEVRNNKLLFVEKFNHLDYKYSSSVIGSDQEEHKIEQSKKLLQRINEERECVTWLLDHLNEYFENHDEDYLKVFYDRYIMNNNVEVVLEKYKINRKRYYVIMRNAEYLAKRGWLLLKPPRAILKLMGCENMYD